MFFVLTIIQNDDISLFSELEQIYVINIKSALGTEMVSVY